MKVPCNIVNPAQRSAAVAYFTQATTDPELIAEVRNFMTPPALRHLPDSAGRGQKSLGRIQQINNRRRFKRRATVSR